MIHPAQLPYHVGPIKKRHYMNRLYDYEQLHVTGEWGLASVSKKHGLDLAYLTKILVRPLGFTRISLKNHIPKMLCIFLTGGANAPYPDCMATLLFNSTC